MGWFDDNGFAPYESGGITGGQDVLDWRNAGPGVINDLPQQQSSSSVPAQFDQFQQVGHDGTINGMNREQWRDAWQSSGVTNKAQAQEWLAKNGGRWVADNGTIQTPFGETGDMLIAARTGNGRAGWLGDGSGQTGGGAFGAAMGGPSPEQIAGAVSVAQAAGGGGQRGGGNYLPADFQWEKFDPSKVDVNSDPGVAFRQKEMQRALQNSAAQKGTLISGGFAKALQERSGELASQEYGNAFSRALGVNQANNQGGLSTYNALANAHLGQGNLDLGFTRAGNDYALGLGNLALGNKRADQDFYLGNRNADIGMFSAQTGRIGTEGNLGLGWANYGLNSDQQNFNQGLSLANMGYGAAGQSGAYGSSYGGAAGGYMTGAGNAQAAGKVGSANAWNQAIGGAANTGLGAYYASKYGSY